MMFNPFGVGAIIPHPVGFTHGYSYLSPSDYAEF